MDKLACCPLPFHSYFVAQNVGPGFRLFLPKGIIGFPVHCIGAVCVGFYICFGFFPCFIYSEVFSKAYVLSNVLIKEHTHCSFWSCVSLWLFFWWLHSHEKFGS